jgi:TonB-dependent SusC/RagA subfamily outer membrane receptor
MLLSLAQGVFAQVALKGTVRDSDAHPLPGVSVFVKGTNAGTFTDASGSFTLTVPEAYRDSTLSFSMIGFASRQVPIGTNPVIDVTLEDDATALDEVVVTGYSTQAKDKITGSVATVSADALVKLPVASIDQALQGRAPGVVVSQNTGAPGEGVSVRIRGIGSVNSGNYPLYIVDGVPTLDITNFPTQDIASITILKDASAAALYGSRAANGVVIVTTKSGSSTKPGFFLK